MSFHPARLATEKAVFRPALPTCFLPGITEMQMTAKTSTYSELLKHPNWQRKRLEMLSASDWTCRDCGSKETTLHVHHKKYVKGRKPWEYENNELAVLCEDCHETEHVEKKVLDTLLQAEWHGVTGEKMAVGFLAGFLLPMDNGLRDEVLKVKDLPFFDIGFAVAALGPKDLAAAVRQKMDAGGFPKSEFVEEILSCLED